MERTVYLDYAATTPVDPRVVAAMQPYFSQTFGNPSSVHGYGQSAEAALELARSQVAEVLGARPTEIVFTGCGSESDNLALRGAAWAGRIDRGASHILISPVEHDAIGSTAADLRDRHGFDVERLPVDGYGRVDPHKLAGAIRPDTALVSIIYANNEIGTINALAPLAQVCRRAGVPLHTDAVQAGSQLSLKVDELGVDLLSLGAHKFYGPKGVGALYVRHGLGLAPHLTGGSHEFGLRAGTQNVPLIVGMAQSLRITQAERQEHNQHYQALRAELIERVLSAIPDARLTGHPVQRLPNHASFVFEGIDGNALLAALDLAGFACSSGSACKTGDPEPSGVLLAIGLSPELALGSLRVTIGRPTTSSQIDSFCQALPAVIERLRQNEAVAG